METALALFKACKFNIVPALELVQVMLSLIKESVTLLKAPKPPMIGLAVLPLLVKVKPLIEMPVVLFPGEKIPLPAPAASQV